MTDARFADADPAPLALMAGDADDLVVISALVQDAVLQVTDISYEPRHRQLALLVNRFRWEDAEQARREDRPYERVRAVLLISDVQKVQSDGIDRRDTDLVLELLALLANWDGAMNEHLPEPLIYSAWMRALQHRIVQDELGPLADELTELYPRFIEKVFRNTDGAGIWCDSRQSAPVETCTQIARQALDAALAQG